MNQKKKVCMIGKSGVGKTSLVARFVHSIYSEKYLTTVGVKIDKKVVHVNDAEVELTIWDLAGDDRFHRMESSYLRGTSGYLLVADGTRAVTLDEAFELQARVAEALPSVPFVVALNKADLFAQWEIDDARLADLKARGWKFYKTSAKDGAAVEEIFIELGRIMTQAK